MPRYEASFVTRSGWEQKMSRFARHGKKRKAKVHPSFAMPRHLLVKPMIASSKRCLAPLNISKPFWEQTRPLRNRSPMEKRMGSQKRNRPQPS